MGSVAQWMMSNLTLETDGSVNIVQDLPELFILKSPFQAANKNHKENNNLVTNLSVSS